MNLYCKIIGHTFVYRTENPKVAWNAGKDMVELHITSETEPRAWLQCQRCGKRIEDPTPDQVKRAGSNWRVA